jgi:hypothetical protein
MIKGIRKKGYFWVTLALFLISLAVHWYFSWQTYIHEQLEHHQPVELSHYWQEVLRDTMENWQSEFLQLLWQVVGLSFLYYVGSPASKEGEERIEEKMDYLLRKIDPKEADDFIKHVEKRYPKK